MTGTLFTFGYGKLKGPADLAQLIAGYQIDTVVDVRFQPSGRNPLWRKEVVANTVQRGGIHEYIHAQGLGNPDFKNGKPATRVVRWEDIHIVTDELAKGKNVALMCVCADTPHCHRRLIVAEVRERMPDLHVIELEAEPTGVAEARVVKRKVIES
jgi:uncharacterized protein (DUF488 family)